MLKAKPQIQSETFNDGIMTVLSASDGVITSNKFYPIRYGVKTVGVTRFYAAATAGSEIEMMVAVPYNTIVQQKDLVEIKPYSTGEAKIYRVNMLQPKDTAPRSLYLTLVKTDVLYTDQRTSEAVA